MLRLLVGPTVFTCLISFAPVFSFINCWVFIFAFLLFISWFVCSRRWCIDKLGVFHANQISICVLIHIWTRGEVGAPLNRFRPSSKIFYWPFQGGTSFVDLICFFCLVFTMSLCASVYMCLVVTCWARADLLNWLSFVVSNCEFVTFPLVSWVRCGTWLYRFLIFVPLLTFTTCSIRSLCIAV